MDKLAWCKDNNPTFILYTARKKERKNVRCFYRLAWDEKLYTRQQKVMNGDKDGSVSN